MRIKIVVATRESEDRFFTHTALGQSLSYSMPTYVDVRLFSENTLGLPLLYNAAIEECRDEPAILVFVHDDLYLLDYFWSSRLLDALEQFDIVGLAGNTRRLPRQPSWCFSSDAFQWDDVQYLSGVLAHGDKLPAERLGIYGEPRRRVKLLDGVLICASSQTLIDHDLYFDEQFEFHFYDMDFSRQSELKGLNCGVWDIASQHRSSGAFLNEKWTGAYDKYLKKWGD